MDGAKKGGCPRARGMLSAEYAHNPYPLLAQQRELGEVLHEPSLNFYQIPRAATVERLLKDRQLSRDPHNAAAGTVMRQLLQDDPNLDVNLLNVDPPMHTRLRELVRRAFTPRAVESYRARVQRTADRLLDEIADPERFDGMDALAAPLPTIVMAELLGAEPSEHVRFKRWTDLEIRRIDPFLSEAERAQARAAGDEFLQYMYERIARCRAEPGQDLISRLIAAQQGDDELSDREIAVTCRLLLAAGNMTTTDLIGNGLLALAEHPDQFAKLRAQPALIPNAVEEILRYDTPVVTVGRIPTTEIEIGGHVVGKGQSLNLVLASANRDPGLNEAPDRFDVERTNPRHFAFGGGIRYCLGAHLARLEAQTAFGALVARFETFTKAPGSEPEYRVVPGFRSLVTLPLRATRAS